MGQHYGWETSDTDIEQALGNLCMPFGFKEVCYGR